MEKRVFKRLIIAVLALFIFLILFANWSEHSTLGSDERGYVTKDVYAHYGESDKKIAVVTGIHPRESIAIGLVQDVAKFYALTHGIELINYNIVVELNSEDYSAGRNNGEGLAAQYILPDVKNSDYDLIIIAHAHEEGYGEGYYIATPYMDSKSVYLAETVKNSLKDFNYYKASKKGKKSTSAIRFSNPLAAAGYPTFVYEIPEWDGYLEAFYMTYRLIDASSSAIGTNFYN
ncbi:MAG: hypothetical protein ACP5C3_03740 [Methanomicrobiales archaeon]